MGVFIMQDFFILVFDKQDTVKPTDSEIARDHFFRYCEVSLFEDCFRLFDLFFMAAS